MKTHPHLRNAALSAILLLSGSCLDYVVNTTLNRDGSVTREYVVRGDSTGIFHGSLSIPGGKSWNIVHNYEHKDKDDTTSEKSQYVYKASKTFKTTQEFIEWMASDTSSKSIKTGVTSKKQFRWFYTYYSYSERYPMSFPFQKIPADSFLTEIEQSVITQDGRTVFSPAERKFVWKEPGVYTCTPADSLEMKRVSEAIDTRFQQWMIASVFQEFMDVLTGNYPNEPAVKMLSGKSKVFLDLVLNKMDLESFSNESPTAHGFVRIADSLLESNRLMELYRSDTTVFKAFEDKIKKTDDIPLDDDYFHSLSMPGKVFATNAEKVVLNRLEWDFEPLSFFMEDYVMMASSRAANPWIMVLSALFSLLAIMLLLKKGNR